MFDRRDMNAPAMQLGDGAGNAHAEAGAFCLFVCACAAEVAVEEVPDCFFVHSCTVVRDGDNGGSPLSAD
ncbi:Uncharacterised protein [Mycobacteroides abscessus subsp. abscessus]|nr:Uncharacterised protein [Mycobacteroides abscessus subsp. abscessus]